MTRKEMFARIAEIAAEDAEVVAFCEQEIERLNRPRKKYPRKPNPEIAEFRAAVATAFNEIDEPVTNADMAAKFEVSSQKMAAALRYLVGEGVLVRTEPETSKGKATFVLA